jgi:flagellar biosynthesis/type III secretory pathway protein FliH
MSKPDWATRLQNTFKRKYDKGYEDGYNKGWTEGFLVGSKKAIKEHKKVIIATIERDLKENGKHYNPGIIAGVHSAISMIRKIK